MTDPLHFAPANAGKVLLAKVLLIMPPDISPAYQPHLGLGILASRLKGCGHDVLVLDYSFLASFPGAPPEIEEVLSEFDPDLIGVSLFSQHLQLSQSFVAALHRKRPAVPIVIGGPHVSLGSENVVAEVSRWPGVRTVVRGEADTEIGGIIRDVLSGACDPVVSCRPIELSEGCRPDFSLFVRGADLETYPIQLSRGCPYECVFCNIDRLAGRRFRKRAVGDCVDEIREAAGRYPNLRYVKVTDDAPNCDSARFENFIERYLAAGIKARLEIMQLRADHLTLKSCQLLKKAGQPFVCIGVESADPEVLAGVNKGETLEHIERACGFVKTVDLPLVMCFVLGLPGATERTDLTSLAFAKKVQPVHCYWNIAQPMHGTRMYDYFLSEGTIYSENSFNKSSLQGGCFADTPGYVKDDRLKVQMIAQAATNELNRHSVRDFLIQSVRMGVFWRVLGALVSKRPRVPRETPRRW